MTTDIAPNLGILKAEYTPRRKAGWLILGLIAGVLFGTLVAGVGIFLIVGAWVWRSGADRFFFVVFGLAVGLFGVWLVMRAIRKRHLGKRVLVYDGGLAYTRQGKTDIIRWEDITAVWQNVVSHYFKQAWQTEYHYTGTIHKYTIQLNDGSKYAFDDVLGNVEELGGVIRQETLDRMLPRLRQAYEAGQAASFGQLSISKAGISKGYMTLPWEQVKNVDIYEGFVNIYSKKEPSIAKLILSKGKGDWAAVAVAKVPNAWVFKAMVDEILGTSQ
jgi:hypothetical protein